MATPIPNSIQSPVAALQTVAGGNRTVGRRRHLTKRLEHLAANAAPDVATARRKSGYDLCGAVLKTGAIGS